MNYTSARPTYFRYFLIAFILYLLFPPAYCFEPRAGLDPSYIIATHLAYKYNLVFGKDFVFPFGPLAILNDRFAIAINRWVFLLFDGYFLVSLFFALKAVVQKISGYGPLLFCFLGVLLALNEPMFQWFFLLYVFYLFCFVKNPSGIFPVAQAGLLSLFCLYYKVNLGIPAIVLWIGALHYAVFRRKIGLLRYGILLFAYLGCSLWLARLLQVDIKGYIAGSLQLIDAYNDAMFIPAGHYTLFLIAALLIFLLVFSRWVYLLARFRRRGGERGDADELILYGVTAFLLFILYKSGFVRMDNHHISHFFDIAGLIPAGLYVFSPPGRSRKNAAVCCWVIMGICIVSANTIPGLEHPYFTSDLARHLSIRKPGNYYQGIRDFDEIAVAGQDPTNRLKKIIGDHTTDIIPMEVSKIYFAGLTYDPRPVIQSYSAYNTYLDSLNYEKYLSPGAPDYVLFSLGSIDHRYAFFDESRTKMALFSHYHIAGEAGGDLLLRKKALTPLREEQEDAIDGRLGMDIPVDSRYDLQYSRIFVRYNLWGRIQRFLYQAPSLKITFLLENGDSVTYPAISTLLEDGILLNKYVDSRQDFQLLMQSGGRAGAVIKKIRIDEDPVTRGFERGLRMVNTYYRFPVKPEPERREDSLGVAAIVREFNSYVPSPVSSSLYTADSFRCSIEQLKTYSPVIRIEGWAEREMAGDGHIELKVLLRQGDTVFELPTEEYSRDDVKALAADAVGGGFVARVSRGLLAAGSYQIGVVIGDTVTRKRWVRFTNRRITIR